MTPVKPPGLVESAPVDDVPPGCGYCRDIDRPLTDGPAWNQERRSLLLRCPECRGYYGLFALNPHWREPLTEEDIAEYFPDFDGPAT